jgi:hypothetical protein
LLQYYSICTLETLKELVASSGLAMSNGLAVNWLLLDRGGFGGTNMS